jgi:hypothetical protein
MAFRPSMSRYFQEYKEAEILRVSALYYLTSQEETDGYAKQLLLHSKGAACESS